MGMEEISNGVITYEGENLYKKNNLYPHGTTAYLYCYYNYDPIGFGRTSCNDGQWKPKNIGGCVVKKKSCSKINIDINNHLEGVVLKYFDEYVKINCDVGYQLNGIDKIKCLDNGEWDVTLEGQTFCSKIKGKEEEKIEEKKEEEERKENIEKKDEIQENVEGKEKTSIFKSCLTPWDGNSLYNYKYSEIFLSHSLLKDGMLPHNTYVSLTCKNSHIEGSSDAHCIDGNWFPQLGICKNVEKKVTSPESCEEIVPPKYGHIKYMQSSDNYLYDTGTHGVLNCKKGYKIKGNPLVTCTINGWVPITGLGNCEMFLT